MSANHESLGYSVFRVFIILFVLTVGEVAWGYGFHGAHKAVLWGGLMIFALAKGALILMYFMHMKYEKMLIWSLILPTLPLMCIVVFALMPDLSFNSLRDDPVANRLDSEGNVVDMITYGEEHGGDHGGDGGSGAH